MMKKLIVAAMLTVCAVGSVLAATGKSIKDAIPLKSSQRVKLVAEVDPDIGETGFGVAYYKVKLNKGHAYTIWITGGSTANLWFNIDVDPDAEDWPMASFDYDSRDEEMTKIAYMYADSWDEEDPSSFMFYVQISGEVGETCELYYQEGIKSFVQEGEAENPRWLAPTDDVQHEIRDMLSTDTEIAYYYKMYLEAGRKYRLWAVGGSAPVRLSSDDDGSLAPDPHDVAFTSKNLNWALGLNVNFDNAVGYLLYPSVSKEYTFCVYNRDLGTPAQTFGIVYMSLARKTPEEHMALHPGNALLTSANNYSADILPGRLDADGVWTFDEVIDESLCKITLKAGDRKVFQTAGTTKPSLMRLYDRDGNILAENQTIGSGSLDTRTVVKASYDGAYYIGVCDPRLAPTNDPSGVKLNVFTRDAKEFSELLDEYDLLGDDEYTGASLIVPYPAKSTDRLEEKGCSHGPHRMSGGDWYDWFCFAGKAGGTYKLRARLSDEGADPGLHLAAKVYKMVNGVASVVTDVAGSLSYPGDAGIPLYFTADEDAMYYVCVSVEEGLGLDYPDYTLHATVSADAYTLGLMQVKTEGAEDGTWSLTPGGVRFANGATICVVVSGNPVTVYFNDVEGFHPVAPKAFQPKEWKGDWGSVEPVVGRYVDIDDPQDEGISGVRIVSPASEAATLRRTFWKDDKADCIAFLAKSGHYYNFKLVDKPVNTSEGDEVFSVYEYPNGLQEPLEGFKDITAFSRKMFKDNTYYLIKVTHKAASPDAWVDSCYDAVFSAANVGVVGFSSENVSAVKNADFVELTVLRTASEGAIRLNYATIAGTAKSGEDYWPVADGVLEWTDGDMSSRTIRVRLIPDLVDQWTDPRTFQVKLWPMAEDVLEEGEYVAIMADIGGRTGTATVTINAAAEKDPGLITLLDQPLQMEAWKSNSIRLSRTGGKNGRLAIALSTVPGTAQPGIDYKDLTYTVVEWADGEDGVKSVPFTTYDSTSTAAKTLTLNLLAVNADYRASGYGDYRDCVIPRMSTGSAVISLVSVAAVHTGNVVTRARAAGVGLSTPIGSWYADGDDSVRCNSLAAGQSARIQFSVTGPGFFVAEPQVVGGTGGELLRYQVNGAVKTFESGERLVLTVNGTQNILFQIDSAEGGAYLEFPSNYSGMPFKWMPLSSISAVGPADKAVVKYEQNTLAWTAPTDGAAEEIWYRVKLGVAEGNTPYTVSPEESLKTQCEIEEYYHEEMHKLVDRLALGKGYRFWWRVECAYSKAPEPDFDSLEWIATPQTWRFDMLYKGTPATVVTDAQRGIIESGSIIGIFEGVKYDATLSAETYDDILNISGCVGGQLPPGLSASGKRITGVPSKAGEYKALVEVGSSSGHFAATSDLEFWVLPMGTAAGDFCGVCTESGSANENAWLRNGSLTLSVTAGGSISAAFQCNQSVVRFSATDGYDIVDDVLGPCGESIGKVFRKRIEVPTRVSGIACAHTLDLAVNSLDPEDPDTLSAEIGTATVTICLADASGVPTERRYECRLMRRNSDVVGFSDEVADWYAGYYTIALAPVGPRAGEPSGNGLLTLTIDGTGSTRIAGLLADGRSISCSAYGCISGHEFLAPVFASGADFSFGGILRIQPGVVPVGSAPAGAASGARVSAFSVLEWTKDGKGSTFDGTGFRLELSPVGGFYDKVSNLRRWYLDRDFSVELEPVDRIPPEMLPAGCAWMFESLPHDLAAAFVGNGLSVPESKLVPDAKAPGRYDLAASVNPWGLTATFQRGSGLLQGSFKAISDDGDKQKFAAQCSYSALLLMNYDPNSVLSGLETDWTGNPALFAGYYLMPVSDGWTLSLPFAVQSTEVDRDWSESPLPLVK